VSAPVLPFPPRHVTISPETEVVYRAVMQVLAFTTEQGELFNLLLKMAIAEEQQSNEEYDRQHPEHRALLKRLAATQPSTNVDA